MENEGENCLVDQRSAGKERKITRWLNNWKHGFGWVAQNSTQLNSIEFSKEN